MLWAALVRPLVRLEREQLKDISTVRSLQKGEPAKKCEGIDRSGDTLRGELTAADVMREMSKLLRGKKGRSAGPLRLSPWASESRHEK